MLEAEAALVDAWELLATVLPGAWTRRVAGALVGATGTTIPTANGVWAGSAALTAHDAEAALRDVAGTGLAHCLQLDGDAGSASPLRSVARSRGMQHAVDLPLMRLD